MVPAAVVIVIIIATSGGSSRPGLPALVSRYQNQNLGINVRLPKGWTAATVQGVVRLKSADSRAIIAITAFPGPTHAMVLLANALQSVLNNYTHTKVKRGPGTKLAGLDARSVVVYGLKRSGSAIRVLLAGARGHSHAYLMDVFTGQDTSTRELVEAQEIILTMRLTG
jgi:hypothetical protein